MTQGTGLRSVLTWGLRLVLGVAVLLALTVTPGSGGKSYDSARITDYLVRFDLATNGDLTSTERIDVDLPFGKHGIFRIFDTADPRRKAASHPVSGVTITRDGRPEEWKWTSVTAKTRTARIGDAGVTINGIHRYEITHRTVEALEPGPGGTVVWWWDVVGSGWQMAMDRARVIARLPADPERVECVRGKDTPCAVTVRNRVLRLTETGLSPFTPVTVKVTFPKGALAEPTSGSGLLTRWLSVLLGLLAGGGLAALAVARTRERKPGFPVVFEPPAGVPPAVAARVLYEDDSDSDLQATLYDLAARGLLTIQGGEDQWVLTRQAPVGVRSPDPMEEGVLTRLSLFGAGDTFTLTKSKTAGEALSEAREHLRGAASVATAGYLTPVRFGWLLRLLAFAATGGALYLLFRYLTEGKPLWWPLFAFAVGYAFGAAGVMFDPAAWTKHTPDGNALWSRTGGFARFLTTESSESRFDAAAHLDWYPQYLPWAVAFGAADEWARRYQAQNVATPAVPWLIWTGHGDSSQGFASMNRSFDQTISSAVASYEAAQAASSGGGGGFSGGSGGGGGGGGSW